MRMGEHQRVFVPYPMPPLRGPNVSIVVRDLGEVIDTATRAD